MSGEPAIQLEPRRVICRLHGEPFRPGWPAGYVPFVLFALEAVLKQEGFAAYAGGDVANINTLLDEKPLCCRMSPEARLEAYAKSGLGRRGFCRLCRTHADVVLMPVGGSLPHSVCFRCIDRLGVR